MWIAIALVVVAGAAFIVVLGVLWVRAFMTAAVGTRYGPDDEGMGVPTEEQRKAIREMRTWGGPIRG